VRLPYVYACSAILMAVETEAKFRVESHDQIRQRLRAAGARCLGTVLETNLILDRPDGSLRRQGCGLRLRTSQPLEGETARTTLTFKGPRAPGPLKVREELAIDLADGETMGGILTRLGYVAVLWYEKRRESWQIADGRVELDEPPHLGWFVEIEAPDEAAVRHIQSELSLRDADMVSASYVHMLDSWCMEHGITDRRLPLR